MQEYNLVIYENIYNELANYMNQQNQKIKVGKDTFLNSIGHKANSVDMGLWNNLDDYDFVETAYLELLRRFPFDGDIEYWVNEPDFRKKLIQTIIKSTEFISLRTEVYNNPYPINQKKEKLRRVLYKTSYERLNNTWYYKLYMKLPVKIRKILKSTLNKYIQ